MMEIKSNINGVAILFNFSVSVNTIASSPPTEFTKNYLKTLSGMAGEHFSKQMAEAMIERINEDFKDMPREKLWVSQ